MRLLTDGMKFITAKELKDYRCVLAVPGYQVWEHPTTFHTYVIHKKYKSSTEKVLVVVEGVWPGLAHDPPVLVPAGMWREMRKLIVKQSPPHGARELPHPAPHRPQVRAEQGAVPGREGEGRVAYQYIREVAGIDDVVWNDAIAHPLREMGENIVPMRGVEEL